jgi:hypothetical protein
MIHNYLNFKISQITFLITFVITFIISSCCHTLNISSKKNKYLKKYTNRFLRNIPKKDLKLMTSDTIIVTFNNLK